MGVPPGNLILKKREFSLLLNIPHPPCVQCYDITEQLCAQTFMFCSTLGQGRGKEGKKESSSLPNTFADDCSLPCWASNPPNGMRDEDLRTSGWEAFSDQN